MLEGFIINRKLSFLCAGQVLCALKNGAKNVTEIIEETGLGQANVSKHLKILTQAGIVQRQPQGVSVYYQIIARSQPYQKDDFVR